MRSVVPPTMRTTGAASDGDVCEACEACEDGGVSNLGGYLAAAHGEVRSGKQHQFHGGIIPAERMRSLCQGPELGATAELSLPQ